MWNSTFKSKIDNWKQSENFIAVNQDMSKLITHVSDLNEATDLLTKIYKKTGTY